MAWYGVLCTFESRKGASDAEPLYEESVFLIQAQTPEEALERASQRARAQQVSFLNVEDEPVEWVFLSADRAYEILESFVDGAEVFSRFLGQAAYTALRNDV